MKPVPFTQDNPAPSCFLPAPRATSNSNTLRFVAAVSFISLAISTARVCMAGSIEGRWEGVIQIPNRELALIVDLAQDENGTWSGSFIMPEFNVKGKALKNIVVRDSEVSFAFATGRGLEATLKGGVESDGDLSGDFLQAGNTARFILKKIGPPQVEQPLRSSVVSKELEGEWRGQFELYGYPRKVTIKLINREGDGAAAEFIVVGRKTTTLPVDLVRQEGKFLMIDSHETGISYEGSFKQGSSEIEGTYTQATIEIPLVLKRSK